MENEVYVWNEETEDPLEIDFISVEPNTSSKPLIAALKQEMIDNHEVIKQEPVNDCEDDTENDNYPQENYTNGDNSSDDSAAEITVRSVVCKMCKKPFNMVLRSNLMIKGYCDDCLNISRSDSSKSFVNEQNDLNIILKCKSCDEIFNLKEKLEEHMNFIRTCNKCNRMFCKLIDFTEHDCSHLEVTNSVLISQNDNTQERELRVSCQFCSKLVFKKSLAEHMEKHSHDLVSPTNERRVARKNVFDNDISHPKNSTKPKRTVRHSIPNRNILVPAKSSQNSNVCIVKPNTSFALIQYNYLCELCKETFDDLELLKTHLISDLHVNTILMIVNGKLSCKSCSTKFDNVVDLKSHLLLPEHIFENHITKTNVSLFNCNICSVSFSSKEYLNTHELLDPTHKTNVKQNKIGTNETPEKKFIQNLSEVKIKIEDVRFELKKDNKVLPFVSSGTLLYSCKTCNKSYNRKCDMTKHVRGRGHIANKNPSKYEVSSDFNESVNLSSDQTVLNVNGETTPEYEFCNSKQRNTITKNSSLIFACQLCEKSFDNRCSLRKHQTLMKHHVDEISTFICKCDAKFNSKGAILYHATVENHYVKFVGNFKCIACCVTFSYHSTFLRHCSSKRHFMACCRKDFGKKFCHLCNFHYNDKNTFRGHITSKPHIGHVLQDYFDNNSVNKSMQKSTRINLTNLSVHDKKLWCELCLKVFGSSFKLSNHKRRFHKNVKIFKCQFCPDKKYSSRSSFSSHFSSYHKDKPCKCNTCGKMFPNKYSLLIHSSNCSV